VNNHADIERLYTDGALVEVVHDGERVRVCTMCIS
jgi:hypothetical protein